jgi:hypothetical protein
MSISNLTKSIGKFIFGLTVCIGVAVIIVLAFLAALVFLGYCAKLYAQFFMLGWNLGPSLFKNFL